MNADVPFGGLLIVALIAAGAPLVASTVRIKVPAVVLEIVAGIIVGPSVLGWVEIDQPIEVLSLVGLAFLLFLAGLEIDLMALRGNLLRLPLLGFAATLLIGLLAGGAFEAVGWVNSAFFVAIALSATSLGLVVPVLKDAGAAERPVGQLTMAGATIADFGAVILLSFFFSESEGGASSKLLAIGAFALVIAVTGVAVARAGRSLRIDAVLVRLQDTTAEIRVRLAVALLIGFVALASNAGLETILGAFVAGAVLGIADRDTSTHPQFRLKLDAVGYGFVIPVFFVASGVRFDLDALTGSPSAIARVPLFLLALLLARGGPALLYRRVLGVRQTVVAGLLQATSLPFIVTATQIGVGIGAVQQSTAAALVCAGLVSVIVFPPLALAVLGGSTRPAESQAVLTPIAGQRLDELE